MWPIGTAGKFRMKLYTNIERKVLFLKGFHQTGIRTGYTDYQHCVPKLFPKLVIKFIAVAVTLLNKAALIAMLHFRSRLNGTGVISKAEGASFVNVIADGYSERFH